MEQSVLIIGIPTLLTWSTCTEFHSSENSVTVCLTVHDKTDAAVVGRDILHSLQKWSETVVDHSSAQSFLSTYQVSDNIEIVIWFRRGKQTVFFATRGMVAMQRGTTVFSLIDSQPKGICLQGQVEDSDTLIFGTQIFAKDIFPELQRSSMLLETAKRFAESETNHQKAGLCGEVFCLPSKTEHTDTMVSIPTRSSETQFIAPQQMRSAPVHRQSAIWLQASPRMKKFVALLVCVALLIGGIVGLQQYSLRSRSQRIERVAAPLQQRLNDIQSSSSSRVEKEKLLGVLVTDIQRAQQEHSSDQAIASRLQTLINSATTVYETVAKVKRLDHLSVFYDFRLITADFIGSQIAFDDPGKLAVFLDTSRGKIVSLSLEKKQPQTLSLSNDLGDLQSLSILNRKAYVLGTKGIYEVSLPLDTEGKMVASASAGWVKPKQIGSFGSNVYVLDPDARQIFRYDTQDFTASPSSWLRGKEGVDFDSVNSLIIDGDVFVGTTAGSIYKFSRGDRTSFAYQDIAVAPSSTINLYTSETAMNLYVLDPRGQRILVLTKSGTYLSSILSPELATATGLIVDEEGKHIYVLAGSLVYQVDL